MKEIDLRKRVRIKEAAYGEVVLAGFVQDTRILKNVVFMVLRDSTGVAQIVFKKGEVDDELFNQAKTVPRESVVAVRGVMKESPIARLGREVKPLALKILSEAKTPLPIEFLDSSVSTKLSRKLDYRFLDLRNPKVFAVFRVQSVISGLIHEFFRKNGFIEVHTSKLVAEATESGASVFPVEYFGKTVYLAQSPQFYKQMLMASGFEKVYEVGPVFRAEPHHTPRHLCEYTSIDFEVSYIEDYNDVMDIVEEMILYVTEKVGELCREEFSILDVEPPRLRRGFPRIPMREAYKLVEKEGYKPVYMEDLDTRGEKIFAHAVEESYGYQTVFLTEFPWKPDSRPFYVMRKEEEPDWTYSFDLLWNGLEITTGGQREHRYEVLKSQCLEKGYDPRSFDFYLEFFKYGVPPHGGSGTGLERLTMKILNLSNIREAVLLPRDPERVKP